jgi:hypothetical protein
MNHLQGSCQPPRASAIVSRCAQGAFASTGPAQRTMAWRQHELAERNSHGRGSTTATGDKYGPAASTSAVEGEEPWFLPSAIDCDELISTAMEFEGDRASRRTGPGWPW